MPLKLTKMEQKVHDYVMLGITPKNIAEIFEIAPNRIHKTLIRIYAKRNVSGLQGLMALKICELQYKLSAHHD